MKEVKEKKKPILFYYIVALAVIFMFNAIARPYYDSKSVKQVDYGTFMNMTEDEKIADVQIEENQILFKDKDGNDEKYCMGDCAINIDYQDTVDKATGAVTFTAAQKLAEVAVESARTAEFFGIDPKVALLSFSTKGSGKGGTVQLSHDATIEAQKLAPEMAIDGEMQFDAAVSPVVGQLKFPGSKVAGYANTFIFPCIEAGNIGYKIAQRLGGFEAYGPILQGLNAPINDLSRGCNADEVYKMSLITACQS